MNYSNNKFEKETQLYGNDICALIETYCKEISNAHASTNGDITDAKIRGILIAYAVARNMVAFGSFKDGHLAKKLLQVFMGEIVEKFAIDNDINFIETLTDNFHKELMKDPRKFNTYVIDIYAYASKTSEASDELVWLKNYIRAIDRIDANFTKAAEQFGFL